MRYRLPAWTSAFLFALPIFAYAQTEEIKAGTRVTINSGTRVHTHHVSNAGTVTVNGGTTFIRGNLTNNGTFSGDQNSVAEFNGSGSQSILGSNLPVFGKLRCNNAGNTVTVSTASDAYKLDVVAGMLRASAQVQVTSTDTGEGDPMALVRPGAALAVDPSVTLKLAAGALIVSADATSRGELELMGSSGQPATIDAIAANAPYAVSVRGGFKGSFFAILHSNGSGLEFKNAPGALDPMIRRFEAGTFDFPTASGTLVDFSQASPVRIDTNSTGLFDGCRFDNSAAAAGPSNVKSAAATQFKDASGQDISYILFRNHAGALSGEAFDSEAVGENKIRWLTAPAVPADMAAFKLDGTTSIPVGGTTNEDGFVFKATVSHPDSNQVRMEVEVKPIGTDFDGSGTLLSPFVASGGTASVTASGLAEAGYHIRARAIEELGAVSDWQSYGANQEIDPDLTIAQAVAPPIITTSSHKTKDTTPRVQGTHPSNAQIEVFANGQSVGTTTASGGNWSLDASALTDGSYTIIAKATVGSQTSDPSNSITLTIDTVPPLPPTNVRATAQNGAIVVEWDASPSTDVHGYHLYRKLDSEPESAWVKITTTGPVAAETRKYRDTGLTNGLTYCYRVKAVDDALNE